MKTAVRFTLMPSCESERTALKSGSPRVVVTGSLTYTLGPQALITRACATISAMSSENTSKEM